MFGAVMSSPRRWALAVRQPMPQTQGFLSLLLDVTQEMCKPELSPALFATVS